MPKLPTSAPPLAGRAAPSDRILLGVDKIPAEQVVVASEAKLLTVQFLQWVAARPRSYRELREAWTSTCPLTCAWEDAISDDLVRHGADGHLALTERGRARLEEHA